MPTTSTEQDSAASNRGLSSSEIADRVSRGQVNRIQESHWADYRAIFFRNFLTLFNCVVLMAATALFLLEEYRSAWAVSIVAVINTLTGFVQEVRAKRHLDQLSLLQIPQVRVRREDREQTIKSDEIVSDDCVLLRAGESIVADGTVLRSDFLEIDEALLTGESDPVPRKSGDRLLSGSFCAAGEGEYRVDNVGAESFANQTSAEARKYRYSPTPLQKALDSLISVLTITAIVLCISYLMMDYFRHFPSTELWQMIASTMTSMVPQGLVLMATLMLTLGALRISREGAVIQRLNAMESMAEVDVLCMDKTGTLTTGNLKVAEILAEAENIHHVSELLRIYAWKSIDSKNKSLQAIQRHLGELKEPDQYARLEQIPFKSHNRYSAIRFQLSDRKRIFVLGAFEALKPHLQNSASVESNWNKLQTQGIRTLVFTEAINATSDQALSPSLEGYSLQVLALIGLRDELRPDAKKVLLELAEQKIAFKILSGDNPETVRSLVVQLGIVDSEEPVFTGKQLESASQKAEAIRDHTIFGRVSPQQKLQIIETLQKGGAQVGMIGDGVNDILALKKSDMGIAMGSGSSAARTVASMVLEKDDFSLLPKVMRQGKVLLSNLRKAAKLFLLKNVYTLLLIIVGMGLFGYEFPYLPQQVSLLNALTIGGPAFLILIQRRQESQPPKGHPGEFLQEVGIFALTSGLITGLLGLAVWIISRNEMGNDIETDRTLVLTSVILMGLGNVWLIGKTDRRLHLWIGFAGLIYLLVMYLPISAYFFELQPLGLLPWLALICSSALALGLTFFVLRWIEGSLNQNR
ncbi:HAD-IC family P-type ATPase [Telmatocola sphagniphila]|uniref:HAD-IC family P-type ATPase n=1 Tax=Telmatocola sphagniphila TaxID=1123043 RepID=A0A8E6ETB8_9BACT|nr:HAD-IC family P-type ATPase [Telmatocola sphagniphila]QVL29875.1 HAD-IC family P-type ATPase [Telmatocola sphagniphila]